MMRLWSLWSLSSKFISRSDPHSFFAGEFQCSSVLKFPCLFDYYLHSCIFVCVCICVQVHTTYTHTHTPIFIPMHMFAFTCLLYAGRIIIYLSQGRPKAPFDIIQKITFNCWNLAQFFCSSLNYCLV